MRRFRSLLTVLFATLVLLAACGDDDAVTTDTGSVDGNGMQDDDAAGDDVTGDDATGDDVTGDGLPASDTEYWSVAVTEDGGPLDLVAGTRISLSLGPDTVGASLGCNSLGGDAEVVDGRLVVAELAMTEMGCDPERHDQDEWFAALLTAEPTLRIEGDALVLETATTRVEFVERSSVDPDRPLLGTSWTVDGFLAGEMAMSLGTPADGELRFDAESSEAIGFDGCNGFVVPFEVDGADIRFGEVEKEEVSCPENEDYQERVHAVIFAERVAWSIQHDRLTLVTPDGRGVTFVAQD